MLGNLGSTLVFLIVLPVVYLILGTMKIVGKRWKFVHKSYVFLIKFFDQDFLYSFYISQFVPIMLACLLNLRKNS